MEHLKTLGKRLEETRKKRYPKDSVSEFALRINTSKATVDRMQAGNPNVGIGKYYAAARLLGCADDFDKLFAPSDNLFEDF